MDRTTTDLPTADQLAHTLPAVVVHTAFRREFRLAGPLVRRVAEGDTDRAAVVAAHLDLLLRGLHHHHELEDDLIWPPLQARAPQAVRQLVILMESQHARLAGLLERLGRLVSSWTTRAAADERDELAETLDQLHVSLTEHLDVEEAELLPEAARHIAPDEWQEIGRRAEAGNERRERALVFGMLQHEGDPEVLAAMLRPAPLPVRVLIPRLARRAYRRHAIALHGTPNP